MVEHDEEMIQEADYVVDIGPKAGVNGGDIIFQGTPKKLLKANTITADYMSGRKKIEIPTKGAKAMAKKLS